MLLEEKQILEIRPFLKPYYRQIFDKALEITKIAHEGQWRKSKDEPYIVHVFTVSYNLFKKFRDFDLIIAGLLHDTVEDSDKFQICDIYENFGDEIGFIVEANTKTLNTFTNIDLCFNTQIERFLWASMKNIKVLLMKIADRAHNIHTIRFLKDNKQIRMAFETQAIYLPLQKIIKYDETNISTQTCKKHLEGYILNESIREVKELQSSLISNFFAKDVSIDVYKDIYENVSSVIWQIEDINLFKKMFDKCEFENDIEIESIVPSENGTKVNFKFKKGTLITDKDIKFGLSYYQQGNVYKIIE